MLVKVFSAALQGVDAVEVEVEVNSVKKDKFTMQIVGLPDASVRESSQRVLSAISNSALAFNTGLNTVNLAPADLRKEGPSFDLPIAVAMAAAGMEKDIPRFEQYMMVGELALDGSLRPVKGVISIALEARKRGKTRLIVPEVNAAEAAVVEGVEVYGMENLHATWRFLTGEEMRAPYDLDRQSFFSSRRVYQEDLCDVKGQHMVKRALEVAAAGGHNLLMVGPPGTGKSMIAKRMGTILPDMTEDEAIQATKIHSISGRLNGKDSFMVTRPFRSPHHTISDAGLLGGGTNPGPGEVSLAHNGVLFLDELPEFRRQTLEVLRAPLEDRETTISRAMGSVTFPSDCLLIAAMNPCPCGYYGDLKRECRCSPVQIERYRRKISGPLLDRIDLHVEVPLVPYKELKEGSGGESSEVIRGRVTEARDRQLHRFRAHQGVFSNASMPSSMVAKHCKLDEASSKQLEQAMEMLNFSARAHDRILKVARTLADLEAQESIQLGHILEAIQYRSLDRKLMM
ncbi:magnesium chelatase family protein [Rubritalea squalenifaciens DSM 18772]|uniref:Magnesium chelatase family protein n=1 Tax=Rubritalea squalenifaciens DSM 18772 TaxID=1123071 RepID=A0A1M6IC96_9BACT|nr:YifB family Mg chelatase-like AAA ATPase [Rubritalea squalenifaciens]SHJ32027.1 magnesium chelatase family protein [Rubritalea squalenifaciens DSM 18772]